MGDWYFVARRNEQLVVLLKEICIFKLKILASCSQLIFFSRCISTNSKLVLSKCEPDNQILNLKQFSALHTKLQSNS